MYIAIATPDGSVYDGSRPDQRDLEATLIPLLWCADFDLPRLELDTLPSEEVIASWFNQFNETVSSTFRVQASQVTARPEATTPFVALYHLFVFDADQALSVEDVKRTLRDDQPDKFVRLVAQASEYYRFDSLAVLKLV